VPHVRPDLWPGDNLFTQRRISWDPDTGKMDWYFQYTPGDMWISMLVDQILIDGEIAGQIQAS